MSGGVSLDDLPDDFVEAEILSRLVDPYRFLFQIIDKRRYNKIKKRIINPNYETYYNLIGYGSCDGFKWFLDQFGYFEDPSSFYFKCFYFSIQIRKLDVSLYLLSKIKIKQIRSGVFRPPGSQKFAKPAIALFESLRDTFALVSSFEEAKENAYVLLSDHYGKTNSEYILENPKTTDTARMSLLR